MRIVVDQGSLSGKVDLDGKAYSLNTNYTSIDFTLPSGGYYYEGKKLYKLNKIGATSPGAYDESMNGKMVDAQYTYTYELIPTTERPKASSVTTVKHKDNIEKQIVEKYVVNGTETTKENYEKSKVGAWSEKSSTKYVKDLSETLINTEETFLGGSERDTTITWSDGTKETVQQAVYKYQVDEYYKVTQQYLKTYTLTTSGTTPTEHYTITWKNWDGTTLGTTTVSKGSTPSYSGSTPTRPADSNYTYTFKGWSPSVTAATGNTTYTAQYTAVSKADVTTTYTITWKNWDGTMLKKQTVSKGVTPSYGSTPTRPDDSSYTYTFKGWSPSVTAATGNATYTAQYTATPKSSATTTYTITWKNWNGSILATTNVRKGTTPVYSGSTPTKPADSSYTYTFNGWSPSVTSANANTTYVATFKSTPKTSQQYYTITWKNWNGTILKTQSVAKGTVPSYGSNPTRPADSSYTYSFKGWSPSVTSATSNKTYTATYTAIKKAVPQTLNVKVKISKPKASKGAITAKWKKLSKKNQKKVSKIEVQISKYKNFSSCKTYRVNKKSSSKKITKLQRKTKYYIRVRAINGSKVGAWSSVKSIKTK